MNSETKRTTKKEMSIRNGLTKRKQSALRQMGNLNLVDEKRHDNRKWRFKIENSLSNAEAFIRVLELKCAPTYPVGWEGEIENIEKHSERSFNR